MTSKNIILGSKSPRRQEILSWAGFSFSIKDIDCDESYPENLPVDEIARYLAQKKSKELQITNEQLLITADTTVVLGNKVLEKPKDEDEAKAMLNRLSNNTHQVITGVCIRTKEQSLDFQETTTVRFNPLSEEDITFYVEEYQPLDKAGAYGIQEWISLKGIHSIKGSYYNVVGLPIEKLEEILALEFNIKNIS